MTRANREVGIKISTDGIYSSVGSDTSNGGLGSPAALGARALPSPELPPRLRRLDCDL